MKTSIAIDLDNDEFSEGLDGLAFILRQLADNIDRGNLPTNSYTDIESPVMWIMDRNGNRVGTWKLTE